MCIVPEFEPNAGRSFACAQAGCQECQTKLLAAHSRLIHWIVRRQWRGNSEYGDLIQEGRIALWQAILHFDPQRGTAFSTYAGKAIQHRVWRVVEKSQKAAGWLEPNREGEILERVVNTWQTEQVRQVVAEGLGYLPERLGEVLRRAYGLDDQTSQSLAAIGREWGITRERVRQLRNDGLVLLRLPLLSLRLRSICEQDTRAAYRRSQQMNRAWQRRRRGRA